ncbi:MAG: septal ring lytic transglycosylase RlpA family protein [Siphonobacter sp.]
MRLSILKISVLLSWLTIGKAKAQSLTESIGLASIYHSKFEGRKTSAGESFTQDFLTGAHRYLPFGSLVEVTNTLTNKSVIVRINDRGPYVRNRLIDLSHTAATILGIVGRGVAEVKLRVLRWGAALPNGIQDMNPQSAFFASDSLVVSGMSPRVSQ